MSEPAAPSASAPPSPSPPAASGRGFPVLRLLPPFAAAAILAVILGRAVGPSIAGIAVGIDRVIPAIEYAGWVLTQLLGMGGIVVAMAAILSALRSRLPQPLRLASIGLGGVVILVGFLASPRREALPPGMLGLMAGAAAVLAILGGLSASRTPFARAAGLVLVLAGAASLVRLAAVGLAYQASAPGGARLEPASRAVATGSFLVGALAVAAAAAWITVRSKRLPSPQVVAALGVAVLFTRQALLAERDDAGPATLLVRRAAERLLERPAPYLPLGLQIFVAVLAPLLAILALFASRGSSAGGARTAPITPAIGAAIALALLVRDAPEVPLAGLLLVIAALGAALGAHDERAIWDAIDRRD